MGTDKEGDPVSRFGNVHPATNGNKQHTEGVYIAQDRCTGPGRMEVFGGRTHPGAVV